MVKNSIKTSGFSLAKGQELVGDDFYDVKKIGNLTVAVVCDGVGSAEAGREAAMRAAGYLINNFKIRPKAWSIEKSIKTFIKSINSILYQESIINYERAELVTTLCIVVIEGNRLYGANVGDSRVYLYRDDHINQLSFDHVMEEAEYKNVLTQAIGIDKDIEPYYFENIIRQDDKILLCSDGLYNIMSQNRLENEIKLGAHSLVKKASALMNDNLNDDTTAVVVEILEVNQLDILKHQKLPIAQQLRKDLIIDGYRLEKPLALNNRTWLCSKKTKRYVLKFAPAEAEYDERVLDLFIKEALNAKRTKAAFFPRAVIPKNRTFRYYVMEHIEGKNLNDTLLSTTLSIDNAVGLGKFLLEMSFYLLKYDLVHGDIKPQNIMLRLQEHTAEFKIVDFGSITEIFSISSKAGTPSFLSPERFSNDSISESSEIFSIGVTLYVALTKKYPYGEIEPFQTPSFKEAKKPSLYNKNIPDWLESIILRAIAPDKQQRYSHYSEMIFEIGNPQKVKPYFSRNTSLLQKHELTFYKSGFTIMVIINFIILVWINSNP